MGWRGKGIELEKMPMPEGRSHFANYLATIGGDNRTKTSVESIMGRMNELLEDRHDGRLSGLVVGRVQSGKTRNYVGLTLKAADEGWNVIIVLTSPITALAEQTEKRIKRDFKKSKVYAHNAAELNFLQDANNPDAEGLSDTGAKFFFWGVAMKQTTSLRRIATWVEKNKSYAKYMKVLVIDDEADNSTPDSNAGKDKDEAEREIFIQNVSDAMLEIDADRFGVLSDWLADLWMLDMPDDAAETQEAKDWRALKDLLQSTKNPKKITAEILDSAVYTKLLGLNALASEQDEFGDELADVVRSFFCENHAPRSPRTFVDVLKAVFEIAKGRSRINSAIISLVDKQKQDATEYTYPFARCAYIAYTATPYACILNERPDQTNIYPDFIFSLDKPPKYFGLDEIYGQNLFNARANMDIVRSIPDEEEGGILAPIEESDSFINSEGRKRPAAPSVRVEDDLTCIWEDGGVPNVDEDGEESGDEDYAEEGEEEEIIWQTLKDSVAWAFCCAAARRWRRIEIDDPAIKESGLDEDELNEKLNATDRRWTTMLFNVSQKRQIHKDTAEILERYFKCRLSDDEARKGFLDECKAIWESETKRFGVDRFNEIFNEARDESEKYGKIDPAPEWADIEPHLEYFFKARNRHVLVINSMDKESRENQAFYATGKMGIKSLQEDHLWFICGGNTIARGLTLEGLVASYFDRVKKSVAVDTMTQMGRWFGYRMGYELLPRIWMAPYSVGEFKRTAIVEERMHLSIRDNFENKASPCDRANYQMVYYYGRRLSGRARAMQRLDTGVGAYGTTNDISIKPEDVSAVLDRVTLFMKRLQDNYALTAEEQKERERTCLYGRIPLWRNVPRGEVVEFLEDIADHSPENSRKFLKGLVREVNAAQDIPWDVVVAEPVKSQNRRTYEIGGARQYALGRPAATTVANGVARFSAARLHLPYYADIPTTAINAIDFKILRENMASIVSGLQHEKEMGARLDSLEEVLEPFGPGDLRERFERFLFSNDKEPYENALPDAIHGKFTGKLEGYRNRSSSEYMEAVHEKAGNIKPILQLYLLEAPEEANLGELPLVAFAMYWPAHEPSVFCAVTTGLEDRIPAPSKRQFCDAVEAVLSAWNFPMSVKRLRNSVMDRLGPGCTINVFNDNIAQIPEGRKYEPMPNRNAYMPLGWGGEIGVEARLDAELLKSAIELLMRDGNKRKMTDLFADVLATREELGDFFRVGDTNDKARFSRLFTDEVLEANGIEKVCGRPITFRYKG